MRRRIRQTDVKTGVVLEGLVTYLPLKKQNGFREGWFAMGQKSALDALEQFTRVDDFRVLVALLKRLDYNNLIVANQADIARDLSMASAQVNRAIKRLVDVGAILKGPKEGINCSYQLNPHFGWKGSARGHIQAQSRVPEGHLKVPRRTKVLKAGEPQEKSE